MPPVPDRLNGHIMAAELQMGHCLYGLGVHGVALRGEFALLTELLAFLFAAPGKTIY